MRVELVHITPNAENLIAYCARVSNPANQENFETAPRLLAYCIRNKHWSIFEMASACFEITTSRAIAQQILRHRSFSFQEFSQRYASVTSFETYEARRQDDKNRQNSVDDMSVEDREWFNTAQRIVTRMSQDYYDESLRRGIAKEQARFLLPSSATSKLYMHGTIRSWIHYLDLRCGHGTQKEHKDIAHAIRDRLSQEIPTIAEALEWTPTTLTPSEPWQGSS